MSKATLLELADRVEKASGPDRELDGLIWKTIEEKPGDVWTKDLLDDAVWMRRDAEDHLAFDAPLFYTESLDAAMTLVPDGHLIVSLRNGDLDIKYHDVRKMRPSAMIAPHGFMVVEPNDILKVPAVSAETFPLALTAAALRARAQQESSDADQ